MRIPTQPAFYNEVDRKSHSRAARGGVFSWCRRLDGMALFVFTLGTIVLSGYGQMRMLGIAMVVSFPVAHFFHLNAAIKRAFPAPPELLYYTAWVVWASVTGILIATDHTLFFGSLRVLLQMFIMVWGAYAILRSHKTVDVIFLAVLAGGFIQIFALLSGAADLRSLMEVEDRAMGLTTNPNSLGFRMIWCMLCALMFWNLPGRRQMLRRGFILALIPVTTYVIMASGSRKSAVAMAFLLIGWAGFAIGAKKGLRDYFKRLVVAGTILLIVVQALPFIMEHTPVGRRFESFFAQGQGSVIYAAEENLRYWMYVDGLRIFLQNPIFGVGLNNFQVHFYTGQYSHSDYIEPLATTGLIGFVLYQAFYVCLLVRAVKLIRSESDVQRLYRLKMTILGVLTIILIGFGAPHYTNQPIFLLLTAFSAFTWGLQEQARQVAMREALLHT